MDQFPTHSELRGPLPWGWTSWACRTAVHRSRAGSGRGGCRRLGRRAGGAPPPPPPPPSSPHPGPRSHPPFRCSSPYWRGCNHYEVQAYRIADPDPYLFISVLDLRHLGTDPDPGISTTALQKSYFFRQWLLRCQQKISFFSKIFFFVYCFLKVRLQR